MDNEKRFNLYWSDTGRLSAGSPHIGSYVVNELFNGALTIRDADAIEALPVGGKYVDEDGDTWERIA